MVYNPLHFHGPMIRIFDVAFLSSCFSVLWIRLFQAQLLSNQLSRKPLPGLTSIEQLELLALADTFASTKLDLEESPGSIERGVKFAKKEGTSNCFIVEFLLKYSHNITLWAGFKRQQFKYFRGSESIVLNASTPSVCIFSILSWLYSLRRWQRVFG